MVGTSANYYWNGQFLKLTFICGHLPRMAIENYMYMLGTSTTQIGCDKLIFAATIPGH